MKRMSNREYRTHLATLGLSQAKAAALLGISRRASIYYSHEREVPESIAKLLRLIVAVSADGKDPVELMEKAPSS